MGPTEPGRMLSHYRLVEKIGEGSMGVVWRAEDTVLNRDVAIKVLPTTLALDEERREMFLQEARLAASVSHAHIVQVHEIGREGDHDFIVMEFVAGRPLSQILHGRPLPPDKVAELGGQIARGLARAHRARLVHRDLKPANILVTPDGEAKIVDFGLASMFVSPTVSFSSTDRTATDADSQAPQGPVVGTPAYMSPEQIRGEEPDARSDIFSLGTILYEMSTGQRPFAGSTVAELFGEILKGQFQPVHALRPKVPLDLDRIVQKSLQPRPKNRYQSMDDLAVDLKRLGRELESGSSPSYDDVAKTIRERQPRRTLVYIACTAVLLLGALVVAEVLRMPELDENTLLILPFAVRGQEEGGEYVGHVFADAIAIEMARVPGVTVRQTPKDADHVRGMEAARRLGAGRMVAGTLLRRGDTFETTLSLVDCADETILWGMQEPESRIGLSRLSALVALEITKALGKKAPKEYGYITDIGSDHEIVKSPSFAQTLAALQANDYAGAIIASRQLVAAFPSAADAAALNSFAHLTSWWNNPSEDELNTLSVSLDRLEELDADSPYLAIFRSYLLEKEGNLPEAIEGYTSVLARHDLGPRCRAWALRLRATLGYKRSDLAAAAADLEQALQLDPTRASTRNRLANLLRRTHRYEDALRFAQEAVLLEPNFWGHYEGLGLVLEDMGQYAAASEQYSKAVELNPSQTTFALGAVAVRKAGDAARAAELAQRALQYPESSDGCANLAIYHATVGDTERAMAYLRRAVELGFASDMILWHSDYDLLRMEHDFSAIAETVKQRLGMSSDAAGAPSETSTTAR